MAIKKTINANVVTLTLNKLREISPKIYVDEKTLQRLLSKWNAEISSKHMAATLKGHSNIYTIVLVNIDGCIDYCEDVIQKYDKNDSQYESISETIDYLSSLKEAGYKYINVDGQHRIDCYNRYMANEFVLNESVVNETITNKGKFLEDFRGKKFSELSEDAKNEILNTPLTLILVNSGTLKDLVDVTIFTNIGEPWNHHEMRIITPSAFNRNLHDYMENNPSLTSMFSRVKNLDGNYSLRKKGASLIVSEWFAYYFNSKQGKIYNWTTKKQDLDIQSSIEGTPGYSKSMLKDAKALINETIEMLNQCGSVDYERSFIDNAFILMTILNNPKHALNSTLKKVKINDLKGFFDWFAKIEAALRVEDYYVRDSSGKVVIEPITKKAITNSESFKRKCGNKKIDDIQLRAEKLIKKFNESFDTLFADGIISLIDTKNYTKKEKLNAAIESDWIDADGVPFTFEELMGSESVIEGDHIEARSKGGETNSENLTLRRKKANIRKSNKTI